MWTHEAEFDAVLRSMRAKLAMVELQVTALEKERKVSQERLECLEMMASDAVVAAHVELM